MNHGRKREPEKRTSEIGMGDSQLAARFARYVRACGYEAQTNGETVISSAAQFDLIELLREWESVI